jgi:hypothetical protein
MGMGRRLEIQSAFAKHSLNYARVWEGMVYGMSLQEGSAKEEEVWGRHSRR